MLSPLSVRAGRLLALVVLSFSPVLGQDAVVPLPAGVQRVISIEGITEYHLENGLRVLLFRRRRKLRRTHTRR